jgi:pilus assembly protein Flp/PilA
MKTLITRFACDQSGVTGIEYAIVASFVAVAIVSAATTLGTELNGIFNNVANDLQ